MPKRLFDSLKTLMWAWGWRSLGLLGLLLWAGLGMPAAAWAQRPAIAPAQSIQPYLERVVDSTTEFRLENGMKFIVLERHNAPVVSFVTYANVGGVDEEDGKTGAAHFLEHLAFKGTNRIGTKDYQAETELLDRLDDLDAQRKAAAAAGDTAQAAQLSAEFEQVQAEATDLSIQNEYGQIVERAGGTNLNAATGADFTIYFYSFPSNKLELWMSLESERFLAPVFREFFQEQQVILEERRLRTDNSPIGQMVEAFLETAYQVHPYRRPVIGYDEDIRNLTRADIREFFETHYVPSQLTMAIVGDVQAEQVRDLATTYFGRYSARPAAPSLTTVEPPQQETRELTLALDSQPWYLEGYHRPALTHPDNAVYDMISALLSDGRTSRLYRALVEEQRLALTAQGFSGFPGDRYPNLVLLYAMTAPGRDLDEVAAALHRELERLQQEPVTAAELERVKTQARATLLRTLRSDMGMARLLAEYQAKTGDWRNLFAYLEAIAAVTPADVQRVARATFTANNRTIGRLVPRS